MRRMIVAMVLAVALHFSLVLDASAYDPRGGPLGCLDCHSDGTVQDQTNTFGSGGGATALSMMAAFPLASASNPWSPSENISNTSASGSQLCSNNAKAVCVDAGGTTHGVWTDKASGYWEIYHAMRPPGGSWTSPVQISGGDFRTSTYPSVAADSQGNVYAVWEDYKYTTGFWPRPAIFLRTWTLGSWGPIKELSTIGNYSSWYASVAVGPGDQAYIVWQDRRNNPNYEVFLGNDSVELGIVGTGGTPSVSANANQVLCVWESAGNVMGKAASAPSGLITGTAFALSPTAGFYPDVHINGPGVGYAVWNAADWSLGYAKFENSTWWAGAVWTQGPAEYPSVAVDRNGRPHVAFGYGTVRYATSDGSTWTPSEDVRANTAYLPSLSIDTRNNLSLAWIDTSLGNSEIFYSTKKLESLLAIDNVPYYNQGPTSCNDYYASHPNETRKAEPCVGGGPWATDVYDGINKNVQQKGCAITSAVMAVRKMGVEKVCYDNAYAPCSGDEFNDTANWRDVNPRTLNEWAKRNNGYDASGGFFFTAVLQYTNNQIELYKKIESRNDNVLNLALGLNLPPVIHIPGHYMVATGQKDVGANPDWYVNDPGRFSTVVLTDRYPTYDAIRIFRPHVFSEGYSALEVHLASPAEFLLTDPSGRKAGFDPVSGTVVNEIPDFEYGPERIDDADTGEPGHEVKVLYIGRPLPGLYDVKVIGTGTGAFNLSMVALDNTANKSFNAYAGVTAPSRIYDYRIDYSASPDFPTIFATATYQFLDFQPPIQADGSKVFKLGSTIPVKFQVRRKDGSTAQDVTARLALQRYTSGVPVGEPIDATPTGGSDAGNVFRYDSQADQYVYNLSTGTLSVGTWKLIVTLDDGSAHDVLVGIK